MIYSFVLTGTRRPISGEPDGPRPLLTKRGTVEAPSLHRAKRSLDAWYDIIDLELRPEERK